MHTIVSEAPADAGAAALVLALRMPADQGAIRHDLGGRPADPTALIRQAHRAGAKAKLVRTRWERLAHTPLPALVPCAGNRHATLHRAQGGLEAV